jgi:hypothetical protein
MTPEALEEAEYLRLKAKRHLLGNITFIGELFKLELLSEKIMHNWCVLQSKKHCRAAGACISAIGRLGARTACTSSWTTSTTPTKATSSVFAICSRRLASRCVLVLKVVFSVHSRRGGA